MFSVIIRMESFAQCSRAQVIADYNNIYLQTSVTNTQLAWTGNTSTCDPGTISNVAQSNTLARVNYYRKLAGLQTMVTFDPAVNTKCQQMALMMTANNSMSHNPPTSWLCYTGDGAQAALYSNLAGGVHSSAAVDLIMNDAGNTFVGHRRWLLNSRPPVFGHGSTTTYDAMWVVGSSGTADPGPVTFPSAGFFPAPLFTASGYWSFGLNNAGFSSATVQMFDESGSGITLITFTLQAGYGDNTIVWQPSGIVTSSTFDVKYSVKVNNVLVGGVYKNYSYDVIICQPVHPPQCPEGKSWSETDCACSTITGISETEMTAEQVVVKNPFSDILEAKIHTPGAGEIKVSIIDMAGKALDEKNLCISPGNELTLTWNTGSWPKGLYFIILEDQNKLRKVFKAIKQ